MSGFPLSAAWDARQEPQPPASCQQELQKKQATERACELHTHNQIPNTLAILPRHFKFFTVKKDKRTEMVQETSTRGREAPTEGEQGNVLARSMQHCT